VRSLRDGFGMAERANSLGLGLAVGVSVESVTHKPAERGPGGSDFMVCGVVLIPGGYYGPGAVYG